MRWSRFAPVIAGTLLAGSLAGFASPARAASVPAPAGLPGFYRTPDPLPSSRPGSVIKYQAMTVSGVAGSAYRIMYVSTSATGRPVAVTGIVLVPSVAPPAGGYPVVSWAHATNGVADQCAPSLHAASAVPLANVFLSKGWVVVASDYQGEGTPGLLPYLVGPVAGRNAIDIVRAARHLRFAHASNSYVVWGHSEGGQSALFSLSVASSYAPELHLRGVVAGAPPSQFGAIYDFLRTRSNQFYLFMISAGFNAAYGNGRAPLRAILTPQALRLLPILEKGCSSFVDRQLQKFTPDQLLTNNPFTVPKWKLLLKASDPANLPAAHAPLLIIQGGSDELIPVASTAILATQLCRAGQGLERWIYPGQSHAGVVVTSASDMVRWIGDRFAGDANPDPYQPVGEPEVNMTSCSSLG